MAIAVTNNNLSKVVNKYKEIKKKGWVTPYGFVDATKPVTYNEAMRMGAELENRLKDIEKEK